MIWNPDLQSRPRNRSSRAKRSTHGNLCPTRRSTRLSPNVSTRLDLAQLVSTVIDSTDLAVTLAVQCAVVTRFITARCTTVQSAVLLSLAVCPSVCDVGGNSWKLIVRTISPTSSLFVAQRSSTYSQGTWRNFGEIRGGMGKVVCWSTKAAISMKRAKIQEKLLWRAYRKSPTLFRFFG